MAEELKVVKMRQEIIVPAEETPMETLYLSELDQLVRDRVPTLMVYESCDDKHGVNPADIVRDALARVLVYYYPLAGRLKENMEDGSIEVACRSQGVVFVEAEAHHTLEEVGYLVHLKPSFTRLFCVDSSSAFSALDSPLVAIQVTRFVCGGFALGMNVSHCILDGVGASNFQKAFADMARGSTEPPNPLPVWSRNLLSQQHNRPSIIQHKEMVPISALSKSQPPPSLTNRTFSVTAESIKLLKQSIVSESEGKLCYCTTFEALTATMWRATLKAMCLPCSPSDFFFFVNARKRFHPPIPEGYYGNCLSIVFVSESDYDKEGGNDIKRSDIVVAMRRAKERLSEEKMRSLIGFLKEKREVGERVIPKGFFYPTMGFNDWSRFHYAADMGWGDAVNVTTPYPAPSLCAFILPPLGRKSRKEQKKMVQQVTDVLVFLPQFAMDAFACEMERLPRA